ncbi:unnamed protein product, partial [Linum tenue]
IPKGGCCFCFPSFLKKEPTLGGGGGGGGGSAGAFWRRIRPLDSSSPASPWWSKSWKKVRGLSEGPRWKNLVRRFNGRKRQGYEKFNYDATSYALNFDEGPVASGGDYDEDITAASHQSGGFCQFWWFDRLVEKGEQRWQRKRKMGRRTILYFQFLY